MSPWALVGAVWQRNASGGESAVTLVAVAEVVPAIAVAGTIAYSWLAPVAREARRERVSLRAHARATRVYYAAIEAAEDDPNFAPDAIARAVMGALGFAARAWRTQTFVPVDRRPDTALVMGWARLRQSWLGSGLRLTGSPSIDLLRVVNRAGEEEDRVIVRVRMRIHCRHPRHGVFGIRRARLDERWTLGRREGLWAVLSVEGDPLAGPVLSAPSIPDRSYDDARLLEESLAEIADKQRAGDHLPLGDLVSADEAPALAVLDLSVVDGRFLPPLIAMQLAHMLEAWEEAVDGSDVPLATLASAEVIATLLHPGAGRHFVIRDAQLKSWEPVALRLSQQPPAMDINVGIEAVRYVQSDDGRDRIGNDTDRREARLTWTLELAGPARTPWRLAATTNPAQTIPGWS
jgi:hypothetical protein